jgi:molecular chaperone IbpA
MEQEYMHRGVATRTFARGFNLSDDVEVGEVTYVDGMLTINLHKVIPEHQKLQIFDIK